MAKVFLVTGSSRGLGRQIAEKALAAGNEVVATARTPEQLSDLVERYGKQVRTVQLDVTDPEAARAAVATAVAEFGRLDVVVNNAGYANTAAVEDITDADFREQVDTNLFGVVNVTKAAVPILREQGGGHIIQVSSLGGRMTTPGMSAYQAAKFAVGGFSEALAQEVAPLGIKVTVLEPGGMRTDWAGSSMRIPPISAPYEQTVGRVVTMLRGSIVTQAVGDPAKVADVVLTVADLVEPPVRLLLGSDAVNYAAQVARVRAETDAKWRDLSVSTDHDDATQVDIDPLAAL
ncbi:SDR family NAD(P)-dependent oxidoreductase [Actinophytocola algeriensis]|uniref:NAD(P)-dependent dehydrogenase (Short-subunit alcohol dehydrogenase family) n=1 Tax=Actinophytocola algeriensis TaxID=1768010 RepID=A0A7W7Q6N2_9PSEU|nr:SDR family NAD(P)-dependent oxidoreductase [Actinophytocola algeriensis]MBB4907646.1 NAD(P)-dependent dehydrogenase (short-subunit alcohol dehydrogenase family) [Actinophytocola algeriensis]MBE1479676.1 NAD(P)-dependent dehydrogenase (short-subunit alcohol dehydrogenase family) [Actinophytocola algeriensis]